MEFFLNLWHQWVMTWPFTWTEFEFMRLALLGILCVAPLFALAGTAVVNSRMAFFSDILGHSAMTGIAIGVLCGLADPLLAMVLFSAALAVLFQVMKHYSGGSSDTALGVLMSTMVAFGIVVLSRSGGFSKFTPFLVGDILAITPHYVLLFFILLLIMLAFWLFASNRLLLVSLNPQLAQSQGISPRLMETIFSVLLAVVVSVSIKMVGILIMSALLVLPAATARLLARSVQSYTAWAVGLSLAAGVTGLLLSFYIDTASGATIVLVLSFFYALALLLRIISHRTMKA